MKILIVLFGIFVVSGAAISNHPETRCFYRDAPRNGRVIPDDIDYAEGDKIIFECNEGYKLTGIGYDICQKSGTWKINNTPYCEPICFSRRPPLYGHVTPYYIYYPVGQNITFNCSYGYELEGKETDVCVGANLWLVDDTPRCLPIFRCHSRHAPDNGFVQPNKNYYSPGDEITFQCVPSHYHLHGSENDICGEDGTWIINVDPYCKSFCHLLKALDNGRVSPEKKYYSVGDSIAFSCLPGFQLDGIVNHECKLDGQWSDDIPKCIRGCPSRPAPIYGYVWPVQTFFEPHSEITYSCFDGYKLSGIENDLCLSSGEWRDKETPKCVRTIKKLRSCGSRNSPGNGYIYPDENYYVEGDQISFWCDSQYILDGIQLDVCEKGGIWLINNTPYCKPICDQKKTLVHGGVDPSTRYYLVGQAIKFFCDPGFELEGKENDECVGANMWLVDDFPTCVPVVRCRSRPSPKNGFVYPDKKYYSPGDQIDFRCQLEYYLEGSLEDFCQDDGTWKIDLDTYCKPSCSPLKRPDNGTVTPEKKYYQIGDKIIYSCLPGLQLDGIFDNECIAFQLWRDYVIPNCVPGCPPRFAPVHGYVTPAQQYYEYNSLVRFSCENGYALEGIENDLCLFSGDWLEKKTPKCLRIKRRCYPPIIENGRLMNPKKHYNAEEWVKYICDKGYVPTVKYVQCLKTRKWSHIAKCKRYKPYYTESEEVH